MDQVPSVPLPYVSLSLNSTITSLYLLTFPPLWRTKRGPRRPAFLTLGPHDFTQWMVRPHGLGIGPRSTAYGLYAAMPHRKMRQEPNNDVLVGGAWGRRHVGRWISETIA